MKSFVNQEAFFALLRAGLWGQTVRLLPLGMIDFSLVYRLSQEQTVVGLVAAGFEHVEDVRIPQENIVPFLTDVLLIEQYNNAMNLFIARFIEDLRNKGVMAVLVKGQGIAQCYEKPLWRTSGDIDLLLDGDDYTTVRDYLCTIGESVSVENLKKLHKEFLISSWEVEVHGTLRALIGKRIDRVIDSVQQDMFKNGNFRIWCNGDSKITLPAPNNDIIFVFSHILQHFYHQGIGLRQICDWCRLLWTFKDSIDHQLLEQRLNDMGGMNHWKSFAALAVGTLGMPSESIPFYSPEVRWQRKASRILSFILETGSFGFNRDYSYQEKYSSVLRKIMTFFRCTWNFLRRFFIFPIDSVRVWFLMVQNGVRNL